MPDGERCVHRKKLIMPARCTYTERHVP